MDTTKALRHKRKKKLKGGNGQKMHADKKGSKRLHPWQDEKGRIKAGAVPNPKGRPVGSVSMMTLLRRAVAEEDPKTGKTKGLQIIEAWLKRCMEGDPKSIQMFLDRLEGKVADKIIQDTISGWRIAADQERAAAEANAGAADLRQNCRNDTEPSSDAAVTETPTTVQPHSENTTETQQ